MADQFRREFDSFAEAERRNDLPIRLSHTDDDEGSAGCASMLQRPPPQASWRMGEIAVFSPLTHHPSPSNHCCPRDLAHSRLLDAPGSSRAVRLRPARGADARGWNRSRGVREEIETAESMGIDVEYMEA